jgi:hypothetical protein
MTRQTIYRRPVFRKTRRHSTASPPTNLSFDEGDRLLHPTRAMAATCPIHRDEGSFAVFKGLSRRILISRLCGSSPRDWYHIAPSAPQGLLRQ